MLKTSSETIQLPSANPATALGPVDRLTERQNARRFSFIFVGVFPVSFVSILMVLAAILKTMGSILVTLGAILLTLGSPGALLEALGSPRRPDQQKTRF